MIPPRRLLLLLLLLPATLLANPLSHSKWQVDGSGNCRHALYFGERRYLILEHCPSMPAERIIERGRYRLDDKSVLRLERASGSAAAYRLLPQGISILAITRHDDGVMELDAAGTRLSLRRLSPPPPARAI